MKQKRKSRRSSTSRSSGLLAAARFIEGEQREWGEVMGLRWFRRLDRMVMACRDADTQAHRQPDAQREVAGDAVVRGLIQQRKKHDMNLRERIREAINCTSAENGSNTPDFILAEYLTDCLRAFDRAAMSRTMYYSADRAPVSEDTPNAHADGRGASPRTVRRDVGRSEGT